MSNSTEQVEPQLEFIDHFPERSKLKPSPVIYNKQMYFARDIIFVATQNKQIQLPSRFFDFGPNTVTITDAINSNYKKCNILNPSYSNIKFEAKSLYITQNSPEAAKTINISEAKFK